MSNTIIEYIGTGLGLLYLVLEIKQRSSMWIVGLLSSFMYIVVFAGAKFYAGMMLNVYYTVISIYGLWAWRSGGRQGGTELVYSTLSVRELLLLMGVGILLSALLAVVLLRFTDSPVAVGDGVVSAFSAVATWMLAKKWIAHWCFWIVINVVSVGLYFSQGLYSTAFLYLCFAILAVVGLCNWKKQGRHVYRTPLI